MRELTRDHDGHLDLLRLDAARVGEGSAGEMEHLAACAHCRERLAALQETALTLREAAAFPAVEVPRRVDRAVMEAYRQRAGQARVPALLPIRAWKAAAGMAAAAAVAVSLSLPLLRETRHPQRRDPGPAQEKALSAPAATARGPADDLNGDGRTDILDAFLLARALRAGVTARVAWDGNGDGRTDGTDVELLARKAVTL